MEKILIGISDCLLGAEVRFDGGHKLDGFITRTLGQFFEFVPYCPEVAIGLGVPREPIRLAGDIKAPRVIGVKTKSLDVTDKLQQYGQEIAGQLADISGYIFKSKSPSCGLFRVKVYRDDKPPLNEGIGVFAREITEHCPLLPVEEEGRLNDPCLRENFIERVYLYRRWQDLLKTGLNKQRLIEFHTIHKFALMAHNVESYRQLGKLMADIPKDDLAGFSGNYINALMAGFRTLATKKKHTNVMHHLLGYIKDNLTADDKLEIIELIDNYRKGLVPLIVPITLINHYFRLYPSEYVGQQVYLHPYPGEMMLRNVV